MDYENADDYPVPGDALDFEPDVDEDIDDDQINAWYSQQEAATTERTPRSRPGGAGSSTGGSGAHCAA